jgi:hypothetical protein
LAPFSCGGLIGLHAVTRTRLWRVRPSEDAALNAQPTVPLPAFHFSVGSREPLAPFNNHIIQMLEQRCPSGEHV